MVAPPNLPVFLLPMWVPGVLTHPPVACDCPCPSCVVCPLPMRLPVIVCSRVVPPSNCLSVEMYWMHNSSWWLQCKMQPRWTEWWWRPSQTKMVIGIVTMHSPLAILVPLPMWLPLCGWFPSPMLAAPLHPQPMCLPCEMYWMHNCL